MIVLSRNREEASFDTELAAFGNIRVWSIPFLYDLRAFGPTVQRLRTLKEPTLFLAPLPVRVSESLFAFLEIRLPRVEFVDISHRSAKEVFADIVERPIFNEIRGEDVPGGRVDVSEEPTVRRWYPVIDRKECIDCLECVNFCLFGVYTIGRGDRPLVDQPDACRDGCPACSRICPGGAILFPMHDDPNISGRVDAETVRQRNESALAEQERGRHLDRSKEKDDLDDFVDQVDGFSF